MQPKILVPLDGSALASEAIPHAAEIARRTRGTLHLVRVHEPITPVLAAEQMMVTSYPAFDAPVEEAARAWLFTKSNEVRASTGLAVTAEFRVGNPVDELSAAAQGCDATAIVCTTHGVGGWAPQWLGSVTDGLIRHAGCPVLAMSESAVKRSIQVRRVLLLLDGHEVSTTILPSARWFARAFDAAIELLRVAEAPWFGEGAEGLAALGADRFGLDEQARHAKFHLDAIAKGLRAEGFPVSTVVKVSHDPGGTILDHITATNPDVVALATRGRGLSRLFVGSVANKVLRAGGRPMLCIRPPASPTPAAALHAREFGAIPDHCAV
jgi:nucleotide-binding universal stress UspA family protein